MAAAGTRGWAGWVSVQLLLWAPAYDGHRGVSRSLLQLRGRGGPPFMAAVQVPLDKAISVSTLREDYERGEPLDGLLRAAFPFPLDDFQETALQGILNGSNVLLSAPTGSGKTVVGEMAVLAAAARGQRAVYTTPLKALSNQKFFDFCDRFGAENVGLLTGDVCIRREAPILLMTTEVFRNILFDEDDERDGGEGMGALSPGGRRMLPDIGVCVLDEFHWMSDPARGFTWEEIVIHAPRHLALVALSATVPNCDLLREWFEATHQRPTQLVLSSFRPVPLRFHFADGTYGIQPLFSSAEAMPVAVGAPSAGDARSADTGESERRSSGFAATKRSKREKRGRGTVPKLNPRLRRRIETTPSPLVGSPSARGGRRRSLKYAARQADRGRLPGRAHRSRSETSSRGSSKTGSSRSVRGWDSDRPATPPSMPYLVRCLQRGDMLPAIVFIFSRAGCDAAAAAVAEARSHLLSREEEIEVGQRIDRFVAAQSARGSALDGRAIANLRAGVASHHAGQLPILKKLVERLFAEGLVKVVFATETLAAGINMPCRAAVITTLSKRGNSGIEDLSASSLLQMAGRAGRRGMDAVGHVVFVRSRWEDGEDAFRLVQRPPEPIESHFALSYGSVLKTVTSCGGLEGARRVLDRSFGAFCYHAAEHRARLASAQSGAEPLAAKPPSRADTLDEEARALRERLVEDLGCPGEESRTLGEAMEFAVLSERRAAEMNVLAYLQVQEDRARASEVEDLLPFCRAGMRVLLRDGASGVILRVGPPALDEPVLAGPGEVQALVLKGPLGDLALAPPASIVHLEMDDTGSEDDAIAEELGGLFAGCEHGHATEVRIKVEPGNWVPGDEANDWYTLAGGLEEDRASALDRLWARVRPVPEPEPRPEVADQMRRIDQLNFVLERTAVGGHPNASSIAALGAQLAAVEKAASKERARVAKRLAKQNALGADGPAGQTPAAAAEAAGVARASMFGSFQAAYNVLVRYGALTVDGGAEAEKDSHTMTPFGRLVASIGTCLIPVSRELHASTPPPFPLQGATMKSSSPRCSSRRRSSMDSSPTRWRPFCRRSPRGRCARTRPVRCSSRPEWKPPSGRSSPSPTASSKCSWPAARTTRSCGRRHVPGSCRAGRPG